MPYFFGTSAVVVCRAVAMIAFTIMLAHYVGEGLDAFVCRSVAWRGMVWCGVVWCGVVWCGVVLCGVVWCGVV